MYSKGYKISTQTYFSRIFMYDEEIRMGDMDIPNSHSFNRKFKAANYIFMDIN